MIWVFVFWEKYRQNIGKNKSKNLSSKNRQKLPDHAKKAATDALKIASEKAIQKTA